LRLSDIYNIKPKIEDISESMFLICQYEQKRVCIVADEITEGQSVVVKPFSPLLNNSGVNDFGMSGCSILGDGSIAIILDVKTIIEKFL
ncbi:MAG: chemotaxis protein CheA, partial [Clostridiales bacterium]|nr:chemotaxis protein CheA [Clostridiales bacterium]